LVSGMEDDPANGLLSMVRRPLGLALVGRSVNDEFPLKDDTVVILDVERKIVEEAPIPAVEVQDVRVKSVLGQDFEEKDSLIKSPISALSYVNAGPGTGKSFSLVNRVAYLI